MSDTYLSDPLISPLNRAKPLLKYIFWGGLFCFLIILISLVSYEIHLTKKLLNQKIITPVPSSEAGSEYRERITKMMDFSADPCSDFYEYSCGSFLENTVLPPGSNSQFNPTFNEVQYDNYAVMYDIVTEQWPLISDLYASCMATDSSLDADSSATIISLFEEIRTLNNTSPEVLFPILGSLHRIGVKAFFTPVQSPNIFQSDSLIYLSLYGATISMDLNDKANQNDLTDEIFDSLSAFDSNFTRARAQNVTLLEVGMNRIDPMPDTYAELYANMSWGDFITMTGVNYSLYANEIGLSYQNNDTVIVTTPSFFTNFSQYYNYDLQTVTDYLCWRVILSFVHEFPVFPGYKLQGIAQKLRNANSNSNNRPKKSFFNADVTRPQLEQATGFTNQQLDCIDSVDTLLGDFLGLIFTMKVLDKQVVEDIHTVTSGIQNSFKNNLASLSWLDSESRANATYKLSKIIQVVGHPNKLDRYRGLNLNAAHFLSNIMAIKERVFDDNLAMIGSVFDRAQSEFPATIVNAFYDPQGNTINFPAGILESPMFSSSFPKLMQYARMGYVIGHEITHGFDNHGRLWNAFGMYQPIMDDITDAQFTQRAQCLVDQYNKYEPVPNHFVNGQKTLGENIADLGGVKNAFLAYKAWVRANGTESLALDAPNPILPSLSNQQAFFVVLAQTWCTKSTDSGLIKQIKTDVHSPSKYRVNGPLSNLDIFSQAFNCPEGSPMNTHPKCELW